MTTTASTAKSAKSAKPESFEALLAKAVKAQESANGLWHHCQRRAVDLAVNHGQLSALGQLVEAVHNCKSVRSRELVQFIFMLAGDVEGGADCAVTFDIKAFKFTFKKGHKGFVPDAIAQSDAKAWFEWAKPQNLNVVKFDNLLSAIRKMNGASDEGKVVLTKAEETFLAEVNKLAIASFGADAVTPKAKK